MLHFFDEQGILSIMDSIPGQVQFAQDPIAAYYSNILPWQNQGRLAQMAERSLSMREAPGSIPGLSKRFQCRSELGWRWGQTSNLVRADALEVRFLLCGGKLLFLPFASATH
jgi:hypothetical protein